MTEDNWKSSCVSYESGGVLRGRINQRAKKVVPDSPGLVDSAIGLVNSVFNFARQASNVFVGIRLTEEL